jgi:hypothetical protein
MEKYDMVPIATAARMAIKLRAGSEILVFSESFITITDYLTMPLVLLSLHQET